MRKSKRLLTNIRLTGMHPSGRSFGYWGDRKVYTEQGIPGEMVDMLVHTRQRDWLSGNVVAVKEASESRVEPFCSHADICGGCAWQHIDYQKQLGLKRLLLTEAFQKNIIAISEIQEVIPSPSVQYFRNRLEFSFSSRRWYYEGEGRVDDPGQRCAMGFHPADNAEKVFDVRECFLLPHPGMAIALFIKKCAVNKGFTFFDPKEFTGFMHSITLRTTTTGQIMTIVTFAENRLEDIAWLMESIIRKFPAIGSLWYAVNLEGKMRFTDPQPWGITASTITETANDLSFTVSPASFYQPNPQQAEVIFKAIEDHCGLTGSENVVDLYCGVGTISLTLARKARTVTGIEGSPQAVEDAKRNAMLNRISNTDFICGDILETFTSGFLASHPRPDIIVLDPPRAGTLINIKKTIIESDALRVIYLSCNPISLATDLQMLSGKYDITHIQPFDMFPHTAHIETLVVMDLKH